MENKIRVLFDRKGNTLDVWFDTPREAICEETGNEVVLKKDIKTGKIIGFEKLNVLPISISQTIRSPVEIMIK